MNWIGSLELLTILASASGQASTDPGMAAPSAWRAYQQCIWAAARELLAQSNEDEVEEGAPAQCLALRTAAIDELHQSLISNGPESLSREETASAADDLIQLRLVDMIYEASQEEGSPDA